VANDTLSGSAIVRELKQSGIRHVIALPDITTSAGLLYPIANDGDIHLIRVCKEDEAIGISAGLYYGGVKSVLMFQHTGLLDSVNALRGVAVEYRIPVVMMAGLLNRDTDVPPSRSKSYGIRIVEPILDAMGIHHELIDTDRDLARIGAAIRRSHDTPEPVALLIGRRPVQ